MAHAERAAPPLQKYFKNAPDGIPGNDDTGNDVRLGYLQYDGLLSGLSRRTGLYAVYPVFDKVTIKLDPNIGDATNW